MAQFDKIPAVPHQDLETNPCMKYRVMETVGEGTFGIVAKCYNRKTNKIVALKTFKKDESGRARADFNREKEMLDCIKELDPDTYNLVRCFGSFEHECKYYIEFEALDQSIDDLMEKEQSFSLNQIRPMAKQFLTALLGLQSVDVMHSDIKPNNMMLVDHKNQPFKVKLIDFGLARESYCASAKVMMQVPTYRAPEVWLGLPKTEAVDMWSLGCCLALWYLGNHIFKGLSDFDCISAIVHYLGTPPDELLNEGLYSDKYFVREKSGWRLKTLNEFRSGAGINPTMSWCVAKDLKSRIMDYRKAERKRQFRDRHAFYDLLKQMFELDPEKRITPSQALLHPFITMSHLPGGGRYTIDAHKLMAVAEKDADILQPKSLKILAEVERRCAEAKAVMKEQEIESFSDSSSGEYLLSGDKDATSQTTRGQDNLQQSYQRKSRSQEKDIKASMEGESHTASDGERCLTPMNMYRTSSVVNGTDLEQVEGNKDREQSAVLAQVMVEKYNDAQQSNLKRATSLYSLSSCTPSSAEKEDTISDLSAASSEVNKTDMEQVEGGSDREQSVVLDPVIVEKYNDAQQSNLKRATSLYSLSSNTPSSAEKEDTTNDLSAASSEVNKTENRRSEMDSDQEKSAVLDPVIIRSRQMRYREKDQEVEQTEVWRASGLSNLASTRCTTSKAGEAVLESVKEEQPALKSKNVKKRQMARRTTVEMHAEEHQVSISQQSHHEQGDIHRARRLPVPESTRKKPNTLQSEAVLKYVKEEQPALKSKGLEKTKKTIRRKSQEPRPCHIIGDLRNVQFHRETPCAPESKFTRHVSRPIREFMSNLCDSIRKHFTKPKWTKKTPDFTRRRAMHGPFRI